MPLNEVLPPEVQNPIDLINTNVNTFLVNRERLRSLFDSSIGVSPKSLMGNDWTILRDLMVVELNDALASLQSAIFEVQSLT